MAKIQTRRSVSMSRVAYDEAAAFARRTGVSMSVLTERALKAAIAGGGASPMASEVVSIDALIAASSVGHGLVNIAANGIDAELADLDAEMHPMDAGCGIRVVYDEE
jgi:hypothetical protein